MNESQTVKEALSILSDRINTLPEFDLYENIQRQLLYLLSFLEKKETNGTHLEKINVGHYAVHEFEESDPELSSILKKCQFIVYKITEGIE